MLNQIATIFQAAVNRTNLIEQYDGVVHRITTQSQGTNGTISEAFPVSCTDPTACSGEHYRKAVPDSALRGLAYVEQRGNPTIGPDEIWGYTLTYPVRLVLWINAGRQSIGNCSDVIAQAELNMINCLKATKVVAVPFSDEDIKAEVTITAILEKNPGQIFQGLAYNDNQALYFWPYAYTAIDCNVVFQIPSACIQAIAPTTTEDCIDY